MPSYNQIPDSEPTTFWEEFKETFSDPMIRILLFIAALMIAMFFFGYAEIYEPLGTSHTFPGLLSLAGLISL